MGFDLLELHDPLEDRTSIRLLRVYSVVPKHSNIQTGPKAEQAIKVVKFLRDANEKLKREIAPSWKHQWINSIGYGFARKSVDDWFIGRASIPLIALKKLKELGLESEIEELVDSCDYFSSSRYRPFKIPHKMSEELAYLIGAILGDGHLNKNDDKVRYELDNIFLTNKFSSKVKLVFEQELNTCLRIDKGKPRYGLNFANKNAFRLFNKFLQIPRGKKSDIVVIPTIVQQSTKNIKKAFLEGVFDTDGGKRNHGLGVTSGSKEFRDQLVELLKEFNIQAHNDTWIHKKYNKRFYGLRFKIDSNSEFLLRKTTQE